jgi:hypothetical protein
MNTFDAIAQIRREALSRAEAMRFLVVNLGFSTVYAEEIVAVVFGDLEDEPIGHEAQAARSA